MGTVSTHLQNDFSGGQISYLYWGKIDAERYQASVQNLVNYLPVVQGPLVRRPGTFYVNGIANFANPVILIPFEFSDQAAYIIECGAGYFRFYTNNYEPILNADQTIYEIPNPYAQADLSLIAYTQQADVLYLVQSLYPPQTLSRYSPDEFTLDEFEFQDGPYLDINISSTALTPSATTGNGITISTGTFSSSKFITAFDPLTGGNSPIVCTVAAHGYPNGVTIAVAGVQSRTQLPPPASYNPNGTWTITVVDADSFYLNGSTYYGLGDIYYGGTSTISAISNAYNDGTGQIAITLIAHGFSTGQNVLILGVTGTVEANGQWIITVIDANNFVLNRSIFINNYTGGGAAVLTVFQSTDVGRLIRMQSNGQWGWVIIRQVVNPSTVIADVQSTLGNTSPTPIWQLGAWSQTTGYPSCATFHEDRLCFGGSPFQPARVDFSATGNYAVFSPTSLGASPTVSDTSAIAAIINSNKVNFVRWIFSDGKGLLIGSSDSSWLISPSTLNEALTPSNVRAAPIGDYGSAPVAPEKMGKSIVYLHSRFQSIRELNYRFDAEDYIEPDLNVLAHNINYPGLTQLAYQQIPHSVLWCVREDGQMTSMTYERDSQVLRVGWATHQIGGSTNTTDYGIVESVATIASADGTYDDVWIIVQRFINGQTVRYIEVLSQFFDDYIPQENAFFVDGGLKYSGGPTHTITGLEYLEGQNVSVLGDGCVFNNIPVLNGQIMLTGDLVSTAIVGLPCPTMLQTLRTNAPSSTGVSLGKKRHTHKIELLVHRSSGLQIGPSLNDLYRVNDRSMITFMDSPPPLLEGIQEITFNSNTDFDNYIYIVQTDPTPCCIQSISIRQEIMDGQ